MKLIYLGKGLILILRLCKCPTFSVKDLGDSFRLEGWKIIRVFVLL
jgi:hypothetical protein